MHCRLIFTPEFHVVISADPAKCYSLEFTVAANSPILLGLLISIFDTVGLGNSPLRIDLRIFDVGRS